MLKKCNASHTKTWDSQVFPRDLDANCTVCWTGELLRKGSCIFSRPLCWHANSKKLCCIIVGDGKEPGQLEATVALGISSDVCFLGRMENAFKYMCTATCFVSPSLVEALPYAILLEAMACGCPVIATESSADVKELLGDNKRGILAASSEPIRACRGHPESRVG